MESEERNKEIKELPKKVVVLLKDGWSPAQINAQFNIPFSTIYYHTNKLKKEGLIIKKDYGIWEVKELPKLEVTTSNYISSKNEIRAHAFIIKLFLPDNIRNWELKRNYLTKNNIPYKILNKAYPCEQLIIANWKIHLTPLSAIFYFPKGYGYFVSKAKDGKLLALRDFLVRVGQLEKLLRVSLKTNNKYKFKIINQHYAFLNNEIAREYNSNGKTLRVYAEDGKLWLLTDDSFRLDELETLHPKTAIEDSNILKEAFNSIREGITPKFLMESMAHITQNQLIFDANMKSHIEVVQKLGKGVDELVKTIKELKE